MTGTKLPEFLMTEQLVFDLIKNCIYTLYATNTAVN